MRNLKIRRTKIIRRPCSSIGKYYHAQQFYSLRGYSAAATVCLQPPTWRRQLLHTELLHCHHHVWLYCLYWTAGEATSAERGKAETEGAAALYELVSDDQQFRCSTSTPDDSMPSLALFIGAANKPTSAGGAPTSGVAAGNPIDKLYSMQTSYFTANWPHAPHSRAAYPEVWLDTKRGCKGHGVQTPIWRPINCFGICTNPLVNALVRYFAICMYFPFLQNAVVGPVVWTQKRSVHIADPS